MPTVSRLMSKKLVLNGGWRSTIGGWRLIAGPNSGKSWAIIVVGKTWGIEVNRGHHPAVHATAIRARVNGGWRSTIGGWRLIAGPNSGKSWAIIVVGKTWGIEVNRGHHPAVHATAIRARAAQVLSFGRRRPPLLCAFQSCRAPSPNAASPQVLGLRIYGMSWPATHHDSRLPRGIDLYLTHEPPYGVLDAARPSARASRPTPDRRVGSPVIERELRAGRPRYHLFGHVHEARGQAAVGDGGGGGTLCCNGAQACPDTVALVHAPYVFDIAVPDGRAPTTRYAPAAYPKETAAPRRPTHVRFDD